MVHDPVRRLNKSLLVLVSAFVRPPYHAPRWFPATTPIRQSGRRLVGTQTNGPHTRCQSLKLAESHACCLTGKNERVADHTAHAHVRYLLRSLDTPMPERITGVNTGYHRVLRLLGSRTRIPRIQCGRRRFPR